MNTQVENVVSSEQVVERLYKLKDCDIKAMLIRDSLKQHSQDVTLFVVCYCLLARLALTSLYIQK